MAHDFSNPLFFEKDLPNLPVSRIVEYAKNQDSILRSFEIKVREQQRTIAQLQAEKLALTDEVLHHRTMAADLIYVLKECLG